MSLNYIYSVFFFTFSVSTTTQNQQNVLVEPIEPTRAYAIRKLVIKDHQGNSCERITQMMEKHPTYKLIDFQPNVTSSFKIKIYKQTKTVPSKFWAFYTSKSEENEIKEETVMSGIFFYYSDEHDDIYARAAKNGWSIIQPYSDHEFPVKVAAYILSPNGRKAYGEVKLFGNECRADKRVNKAETTNPFKAVICDRFTADLRDDASILALKCFKTNVGCKKISVNVTFNYIKIEKIFKESAYFEIIEHFHQIYSGAKMQTTKGKAQTRTDAFDNYVKSVKMDDNETLVNGLNDEVKKMLRGFFYSDGSSPLSVDFSNRKLPDFYRTNQFTLKYNGSIVHSFSQRPTLEDILMILKENKYEFTDIIDKTRISFKALKRRCRTEKLMDLIEGDMYFNGCVYWRLSTTWYYLHDNFYIKLEKEFSKYLKRYLMPLRDEAQLKIPWQWWYSNVGKKGEGTKAKFLNENHYNEKYRKKEGFVVGDRITPDNIELFDLLFTVSGSSRQPHHYIYHVKKGFNSSSRIGCAQVLDAINVSNGSLNSINDTHMKNFYDCIENDLPDNLKPIDNFKRIFTNVSSTFVYAVQSNKFFKNSEEFTNISTLFKDPNYRRDKRSLQLEKEISSTIKADELLNYFTKFKEIHENAYSNIVAAFGDIFLNNRVQSTIEHIIQVLKDEGYVNDKGEVQPKLAYSSEDSFIDNFENSERNGWICKLAGSLFMLLGPYRTLFTSIAAKMQVIHTVELAKKKKTKFMICEIFGEERDKMVTTATQNANRKRKNENSINQPSCSSNITQKIDSGYSSDMFTNTQNDSPATVIMDNSEAESHREQKRPKIDVPMSSQSTPKTKSKKSKFIVSKNQKLLTTFFKTPSRPSEIEYDEFTGPLTDQNTSQERENENENLTTTEEIPTSIYQPSCSSNGSTAVTEAENTQVSKMKPKDKGPKSA